MKSCLLILCLVLAVHNTVNAGSRQLGTGIATQIEGTSGSGIVPWATITGYAEAEESDLTAFITYVNTEDYELQTAGVAWGWRNRLEVSLARHELDLSRLGQLLTLPGETLKQDVVGVKARLAGNLVYTKLPQLALGIQYKNVRNFAIPMAVGAQNDSDVDYFLAASKLFLGQPWGLNGFANLTLRSTKANQIGLLGFGGDLNDSRSIQVESSLGVFLNRKLALGIDYRQKPSNLSAFNESDWWDIFVAYFPNRHFSVVGAYVDFGEVAGLPNQTGLYLSIQGAF